MSIINTLSVGVIIKVDGVEYSIDNRFIDDNESLTIQMTALPKPENIDISCSIIDNPHYDNKEN